LKKDKNDPLHSPSLFNQRKPLTKDDVVLPPAPQQSLIFPLSQVSAAHQSNPAHHPMSKYKKKVELLKQRIQPAL
jgi:hypothetical protein